MSDTNIVLGKVGAVYGIKGWVKIHSFTEDSEAIFEYQPWTLVQGKKEQTVEVSEWRRHNNGLIAKLTGVEDRDQAQLLVSYEIKVAEDVLPELPEGEFYWRDLIGMRVVNTSGYDMGVVEDIMETGSNDVLVVKANPTDGFGKKDRLIPYLEEQVIKSVDAATKQINVDWDPGF